MPSVSLVDMVLCSFFFCEQASAVAAANPVGEKSSERGTGSKGFFVVGRVKESPDVVLERSAGPGSARTCVQTQHNTK